MNRWPMVVWLASAACLDAPPGSTAEGPPDAGAGDGGLAAEFRFEDGAFLVDSSGHGRDGTCSEPACPVALESDVDLGFAAFFDGEDDRVRVDGVGSGPFTVTAWIRIDGQYSLMCPVNKQLGADLNSWQICIRNPEEGLAELNIITCGMPGCAFTRPVVAMELHTWHRVTVRWDGSARVVAYDGGIIEDVPVEDVEFDDGPIWFGADVDGDATVALYRGMLDVVRIYEHAVADDQL